MDIFAHLWMLYGRSVIELIAFAGFEVCVYFLFLRFVERHMGQMPRFHFGS